MARTMAACFDNFDDPHLLTSRSIKEYFPRSKEGSILVMSRDGAAKGLGYTIDISTMSNHEVIEVLFRRSGTARSEPTLSKARSIIKRPGFHALAIDQAKAYIF